MENLTPIGAMRLLPTTNQQAIDFADLIVEHTILDGNEDPLRVYVEAHRLEKMFAEIKDRVKPQAIEQMDKYPEKIVKEFGAEITVQDAGVKWDYSQCNHPEMILAESRIKEFTARQKDCGKFLQSLKKSLEIIDPETGECYTVNPPSRTATPTIKVTLKQTTNDHEN